MRQASFTDGMYLNAAGVNLAPTDSWRSAQEAAGVWAFPGLIRPEAMFWACSGFSVTGVFSRQTACQFASASADGTSGIVAFAHGTTNGSDTQTYVTNLAGLVPGAGSQVVYIVATFAQILQTPTAVVGPPQGNPAFNPNFVAFNAYTETVDSVAVTATTTPPDGYTSLELVRTTLTAGQSSINISQIDFSHQIIASRAPTVRVTPLSGSVTLTTLQAGQLFYITSNSLSISLPPASTWVGRHFMFRYAGSTNTFSTIFANGADSIAGIGGIGQASSSVAIRPGMYLSLEAEAGGVITADAIAGHLPINLAIGGTAPANMTYDATGSLIVPNQVVASGNITSDAQIIAVGNITSNAQIAAVGNISTSAGISAVGNITSSSQIIAAGNVSSSAARVIAALGARGFGVGQACTNLNDFPFVVNSGGDYRAGYCILPNNVIIQWGVGLMGALTQVFAFPIAFPTACASLISNEENPGSSWAAGNPTLYAKSEEVDTTFFTMFGLRWVGSGWSGFSGASSGAFRYIAVGY